MPPPTETDVHAMVDALSAITADLDRARRQTTNAGLLSPLQCIADHAAISPSAIADRLQVDRSLVARRIRDSQHAGFVTAVDAPADRRSFLVRLEPVGAAELQLLVDARRARLSRFVDD